jgi:hypothetical protein
MNMEKKQQIDGFEMEPNHTCISCSFLHNFWKIEQIL